MTTTTLTPGQVTEIPMGEAVTAQVVGEGRIETLSDGTRYEVTARGWKKL